MQTLELALIALGCAVAAAVVLLMVHAVRWTGRDARRRGFERVWLLQLLTVIEFPWPWLMYYLVTRNLDRAAARRDRATTALDPGAV
jgi:hypothetical protein